jgi:hypothetical protein
MGDGSTAPMGQPNAGTVRSTASVRSSGSTHRKEKDDEKWKLLETIMKRTARVLGTPCAGYALGLWTVLSWKRRGSQTRVDTAYLTPAENARLATEYCGLCERGDGRQLRIFSDGCTPRSASNGHRCEKSQQQSEGCSEWKCSEALRTLSYGLRFNSRAAETRPCSFVVPNKG